MANISKGADNESNAVERRNCALTDGDMTNLAAYYVSLKAK